jgi:protein-disulfide isomerase
MRKQQKIVIFSVLALIALFFIGENLYKKQQISNFKENARKSESEFIRSHSMTMGNQNAKVYLTEFFDPACETCALFYPLIKDLIKKHEGDIRLILRYAPYHHGSDQAVKMLEAARQQGKYWEALELMFVSQQYWIDNHSVLPQRLWQILARLDLDLNKLAIDMQDPALDRLIAQDLEDAKKLGATKTPSYYVNGKPLDTFGYEQLKKLIESEL